MSSLRSMRVTRSSQNLRYSRPGQARPTNCRSRYACYGRCERVERRLRQWPSRAGTPRTQRAERPSSISFRKPRFGVVSIAEIELPGRADNNWYYIFINGKPGVINPEEAFTTKLPWTKTAAFLAIKRAHPNAGVFPDEAFIGESARTGGGQRFTIAAPIVDGCHACARVGIVYIGFDFRADGSAKGFAITAVHRCPSDARCMSSFSFASSRLMGARKDRRRLRFDAAMI